MCVEKPIWPLDRGNKRLPSFKKSLTIAVSWGTLFLGALAYLQLGRAKIMSGDEAGGRKAYQDFLTLWKDADPDIPILKQAKTEYAKLNR
jgi:hypothetical protein